jgi:Second Messenger Oligonucleotide or Dinucleotide Synthetase domain
VDIYFTLPPAVYYRFQNCVGNRQSALLQEVNVLARTYPNTDMSGDGQVVVVRLDSYAVEVVPAFLLKSGNYWICDTNCDGSYRETNPRAEAQYIDTVDAANNRNLRPLIRMLKAWQAICSVALKSFQLELLAAALIQQSPWRDRSFFWFDWITRDFFNFLYNAANKFLIIAGTNERISLGDECKRREESCLYTSTALLNGLNNPTWLNTPSRIRRKPRRRTPAVSASKSASSPSLGSM